MQSKLSMKKKAKELLAIYDWIAMIESIIKRHSFKQPRKKYARTTIGWIFTVIHEVVSQRPKKGNNDGNLWLGMFVGTIFLGWYFRTQLAKIYDPRRSIKQREKASNHLNIVRERIITLMMMEPNGLDKDIFEQEWEDPRDHSENDNHN